MASAGRCRPRTDRANTCSNAPVAELAAVIAVRDGDESKLEWAKRIYAWVHGSLEGGDRLYLDQIAPDGTVLPDIWSYNQGTMIGAGVLLHRATEEAGYLTQAESTARAAARHFSLDRLVAQGAAFNAVFFRNLLLLDAVSPDPAYRSLAEEYGERMWIERRDRDDRALLRGDVVLEQHGPDDPDLRTAVRLGTPSLSGAGRTGSRDARPDAPCCCVI